MSKEIGILNIEVESASDQENIKIKINSNGEDKLVFLGIAKFFMEYSRQNNRSIDSLLDVFNNIVSGMDQEEKELTNSNSNVDVDRHHFMKILRH